jgi:glycosyltransferase involved in cell wall biosynthesis
MCCIRRRISGASRCKSLARTPLIHTLHIVPDANSAKLWKNTPGSLVTALSRHQWSAYPDLQPTAIIPHGVDVAQFNFRAQPDDYVLYLGRFVSGKGPLHAIRTARELGVRLVLAGPENAYFREKVKPLVDGRTVEYVGFVHGAERDRWLSGARALLYPIQYPEAFGLVLLEAMLCGTPVAAPRLGAVPEIIDDGITGCLCDNLDQLTAATRSCFALNRHQVRERALTRFSAAEMARRYVQVFEQALATR